MHWVRFTNQVEIALQNMSLGAASVWGAGSGANWANEGAWGAIKSDHTAAPGGGSGGLGFWDDAIISSGGPVKKAAGKQQG